MHNSLTLACFVIAVASSIAAAQPEASQPSLPIQSDTPMKAAGAIPANEVARVPRKRYLRRPETTDGAIGISFEDLAFAAPSDDHSLPHPRLTVPRPPRPLPWSSPLDDWRSPAIARRRIGIYPDLFGERLRKLDGERVAIRGFIHPASALTDHGLTSFVLIYEDQLNSYSRLGVDEVIVVEMLPGRSTDFSVRPLTVVGKLTFKPTTALGQTYSVYRIDAESAIAPTKVAK